MGQNDQAAGGVMAGGAGGAGVELPGALRPLGEIAYNFRWSWDDASRELFRRLGEGAWEASGHNPVRALARASRETLDRLAGDPGFVADVNAAAEGLRRSLAAPSWFDRAGVGLTRDLRPFLAAYFCAEFGLAECFQIYSGGLGLLAGDHLKSASDLGIPLVGVGLLYRHGYFHQRLDPDGYQREQYEPLDPETQPVRRVPRPGGDGQLTVAVDLPGRRAEAAVWRADVGRVRLYLLDTNLAQNSAEDREITANLYLGDQRRRIEQEIVLGIGGVRALEGAGERPTVFHMNEGHAAFMALERIRLLRERAGHMSFDQVREAASPAHVFTTHTPVPAGIDRFNAGLVQQYFGGYHGSLGLDMEGFMALGRENVADRSEAFSMAVLAIRTSKWCNGVSKLHGAVSRRMWRNIWPETPQGDVPIGHVTNGVHTASWVGPAMASLYDEHLGPAWRERPQDPVAWAGVEKIPDGALWAARNAQRAALIGWAREQEKAGRTGGTPCGLEPDALTIGFARRFAGYKRATLLFRDPERLRGLLTGERPAQVIVAGKAHPGDTWGKHLIRDIVRLARDPSFRGRVLFLEDYDIAVARQMVRGCDVWLNNPIRGLEASGTSGMKAAANGVLHASILDGWWDEAYAPGAGYMIPDSGVYHSDAPDEQREEFEANGLYELFERQIVPEFYDRPEGGAPARWLAGMRGCVARLAPAFSTHRMLADYAERYYFPAHRAASQLEAGDLRDARDIADRIDRLRRAWPSVRVRHFDCAADASRGVFSVAAAVRLAGLTGDEVRVEVYHGHVDSDGRIEHGTAAPLEPRAALGDTAQQYVGTFAAPGAFTDPRYGVMVRVLPGDPRLVHPYVPGLVASSPVGSLGSEQGAHV